MFDAQEDDGYIDGNYDNAQDFDQVGCEACHIYETQGANAAKDFLSRTLKGINYNIVFTSESPTEINVKGKWTQYDDDTIVGFQMMIFGNNSGYRTAGDREYTDDQYFFLKDDFKRQGF